mgnify:CR=1 FL=1
MNKDSFFDSVSNAGVLKYEITAEDLMKVVMDIIRETTDSILAKYDEMRSPEFIPRKEAMKMLNVKTANTMSNWEKKGYLNPHRMGGRIYYRQDELTEAMERLEREKDV